MCLFWVKTELEVVRERYLVISQGKTKLDRLVFDAAFSTTVKLIDLWKVCPVLILGDNPFSYLSSKARWCELVVYSNVFPEAVLKQHQIIMKQFQDFRRIFSHRAPTLLQLLSVNFNCKNQFKLIEFNRASSNSKRKEEQSNVIELHLSLI